MVENKSSINNTLSFGAKSVNPDILKKLLIGRQNTSDYLFDAVKSIVNDNDNQFILIIGQRGMGKTHLLRVLHHNIHDFVKAKKIVVAYFSEEEYGIDNYFDFLIRIFNAFMRWNDNDKPFLKEKISELQEIGNNTNREQYAEKIIEEYIGERPLIILAENFADILESIKPKEQSKLRAWLYKENKISIIATSQAISKDFDSEDRPFYGFFNTYYLKKLSYEDTLEFLIQLAEIDDRKDIVEFIKNKGKGQIRALHQLVRGNHRLLVTFYQFLKSNTLAKLSENFIKTINDLKPYYETHIRYLPPQQQKILRYIALKRKPQKGIDISKNCFIDQKSATKVLSELSRRNLIEVIPNPSDKRNKLYDINEPLLRISIEVGEHKEGISALFIDFLAVIFSKEELILRKNYFDTKYEACKTNNEKMSLNFEIQAIEKAVELQNKEYTQIPEEKIIQLIELYLEENDKIGLYEELIKEGLITSEVNYNLLLVYYYLAKKDKLKGIEYVRKAIEGLGSESDGYNNVADFFYNVAIANNDIKILRKSIDLFKKALQLDDQNYIILTNLGGALSALAKREQNESLFFESFEMFSKSIKIKSTDDYSYFNWGISLGELARLKNDTSLYFESFEKFENAININPENASSYFNWGTSLSDLAKILNDKNLYYEAFEKFDKSIFFNPKKFEAYDNWGFALINLGNSEKDEKYFIEAFNKFSKAVEINPNYFNAYYNWGYGLILLARLNNDSSYIVDAFEKFNLSQKLKPSYKKVYYALSFSIDIMNNGKEFLIDTRYLYSILEDISKNGYYDVISEWLILALKYTNNLSEKDISKLLKFANKNKNPELAINENYINIFKRIYFEDDKNALYDLPKEQRLFFEENILNNKTEVD